MATWGDKLRNSGRPRIGVGVQIAPQDVPTPKVIHYSSFRNGLMYADRAGDVPEGFFPKALDVEATRDDGVRRAFAITMLEQTPHWLFNLFVHPTLDFQSELIAVDPPWFGIKRGTAFEWFDATAIYDTLPGLHWVSAAYGDTLVFSDGRKSYYRQVDDALFAVLPGMPGAATLFVAFGRLFAGGTLDSGGLYNVLALMWNGTGDFTDWAGPDAGGELLLEGTQADKIVAGRIMSYDTVAILCRRSIWVGYRTGVAARPLDPQFRLSGIGCVFEQSAQTTESGVTFLSDEGVRHFDGQKAEIISGPINRELLPLSYEDITSYRAVWDGGRRRYTLCTPCATFVYQFPTSEYPQGAWFKKTIALTNIIAFAPQEDDPTWDDFLDRTWDDLGNETWLDYATPESNAAPEILYVSGQIYGVEDPAGTGYFGLVQSGVVELRPTEGQQADDNPQELIEVQNYYIEYKGEGTLQILVRDEVGAYVIADEVTLPYALKSRTVTLDISYSIRTIGIALRLLSPSLTILNIKQVVQNSGPALADMVTEDDEMLDELAVELLSETDDLVLWRT